MTFHLYLAFHLHLNWFKCDEMIQCCPELPKYEVDAKLQWVTFFFLCNAGNFLQANVQQVIIADNARVSWLAAVDNPVSCQATFLYFHIMAYWKIHLQIFHIEEWNSFEGNY